MIDRRRLLGPGAPAAAAPPSPAGAGAPVPQIQRCLTLGRLRASGLPRSLAPAPADLDADPRCRHPAWLMRSFLAHCLILLAAWTVTIKFVFPVAFALAEGTPPATYVYWDFWWVIHLWLAWALLRSPPHTTALALGVAVVEIAIIVTKFALFLAAPEWTIWTTNWFINKLFVLGCFCLMLPWLALRRRRRHERSALAAGATASD